MKNNREFVESCVEFADSVADEFRALLFDPQTSGGLLVALAPDAANSARTAMERRGIPARIIGEVVPKRHPLIEIF
jgi:selenide,water dikinase